MPLGLGTIISSSDATSTAVELNSAAPYANTKSLEMDGVGDYFHAGFTQAEKQAFFRDSFTISFWGKFNFTNNGWYAFGFQPSGTSTILRVLALSLGQPFKSWYIDGSFNGQAWNTGFIGTTSNHAGDKLSWIHLALVIEKGSSSSDNNKFFLYENGAVVNTGGTNAATNADMTASSFASDPDIAFGAVNATGSGAVNPTDMRLDEVAFFDTALNASAIAGIYNSGNTFDLREGGPGYSFQNNLIRYYRLEDNLTDTQGNSDGGTEGDPVFSSDTPDS